MALLEQGQDHRFLWWQLWCLGAGVGRIRWEWQSPERAVEVGVKYRRMHITRAADGPCIAKAFGHRINGLANVLPSFSLGRTGAALPEGTSGQDRASPRAHVFGCKVLASELSQVVIDI